MKKRVITILLMVCVGVVSFSLGKQQTISEGYVKIEDCIPLEDVSCKFINAYGYTCVEIGDIGKQLDDVNNMSYADVLKNVEDTTEDYINEKIIY